MTGRWIVDAKGGPNQASWEISVLREDNAHGIASYGWFEPHGKVFIGSSGGPCSEKVSQYVWDRLVILADRVAERLNAGVPLNWS